MLRSLKLTNVGPAAEMKLDLAPRLNLITGDNGLGKSFLLDVAWWALTRNWSSYPVRPSPETVRARRKATIGFTYDGKERLREFTSEFIPEDQIWKGGKGRPANPGLVLYARVDGGFAVWDPVRNQKNSEASSRDEAGPALPSAFVFTAQEVWDGLKSDDGSRTFCNGLISDLVSWQRENGPIFEMFKHALLEMSEGDKEKLAPGLSFARLSIDDARDIPTIRTGDRPEVPVVVASAAIRRILGLVYLLVWAWNEHQRMSELKGKDPSSQVIFLVDEVECHLHPRWQRAVVPSLMEVVRAMAESARVQLVVATHSPLVLASVEPVFDSEKDAWFDLDLARGTGDVVLEKRAFVRHGDVSNWLTSEAFDLKSARSIPAEAAIDEARALLRAKAPPSAEEVRRVDALLRAAALPDIDPFWVRWSSFAETFEDIE